eukprot:5456847-Pleurochrysis_carterae.AAC.1
MRAPRRCTHRVVTERRAQTQRPLGLCMQRAGARTGSSPNGAAAARVRACTAQVHAQGRHRAALSGCAYTAQ